jgi:hypothetical protein
MVTPSLAWIVDNDFHGAPQQDRHSSPSVCVWRVAGRPWMVLTRREWLGIAAVLLCLTLPGMRAFRVPARRYERSEVIASTWGA